MKIGNRLIGKNYSPLVIAEIGINHEGKFKKAMKMIDDAYHAGAECVKFQRHVIRDEMLEKEASKVIPGNTNKSIWYVMKKCSLSFNEVKKLKDYTESLGMIYLSTPFSRAAADELQSLNVSAFKIGSGECNNYPLIKHIASFGKPIILSTGMNDIDSIKPAVKILEEAGLEYTLLHCTSMYPTPYEKVRLGALEELALNFPNAVIGLSDHSKGIYTSLGAVALGASILEKHFTSDKKWPGPDIDISIDPNELKELIKGSKAIYQALNGKKTILAEEQSTIDFAYASVVSIKLIILGEKFDYGNIWVKRPGTGEFFAEDYERLIGKTAKTNIPKNVQILKKMVK